MGVKHLQLFLVILVVLQCASLATSKDAQARLQAAWSVIGRGYDIREAFPFAGGDDPGLRHAVFGANDPRLYLLRPIHNGKLETNTFILDTTEEWGRMLSQSVGRASGGGFLAFASAFSNSRQFSEFRQKTTQEKTLMVEELGSRTTFGVSFDWFDWGFVPFLRRGFNMTVSSGDIQRLVERYGTHVIVGCSLGGRYTKKLEISSQTQMEMIKDGVDIATMRTRSGLFRTTTTGSSVSAHSGETRIANRYTAKESMFTIGGDTTGTVQSWFQSLQLGNEAPVRFEIVPIWEVLPEGFPFRTQLQQHITSLAKAPAPVVRLVPPVPVREDPLDKKYFLLRSWRSDFLHRKGNPVAGRDVNRVTAFRRTHEHRQDWEAWRFEKVGGREMVYSLRSWQGDYLHVRSKGHKVTAWIQPTHPSNQWEIKVLDRDQGRVTLTSLAFPGFLLCRTNHNAGKNDAVVLTNRGTPFHCEWVLEEVRRVRGIHHKK